MRVIRWKNAVTGVESLNITATGIYFPVGKTDSSFIARYSMASAEQTASVERVSSPNGSRVGSPAINVSGTTEVVANERRGLSTGIIVTAISGTLISVLDDNTPITNFPDAGLGRFPAKEDADAYVYGSTVPQGIPATISGVPYSWNGTGWAAVGWVPTVGSAKRYRPRTARRIFQDGSSAQAVAATQTVINQFNISQQCASLEFVLENYGATPVTFDNIAIKTVNSHKNDGGSGGNTVLTYLGATSVTVPAAVSGAGTVSCKPSRIKLDKVQISGAARVDGGSGYLFNIRAYSSAGGGGLTIAPTYTGLQTAGGLDYAGGVGTGNLASSFGGVNINGNSSPVLGFPIFTSREDVATVLFVGDSITYGGTVGWTTLADKALRAAGKKANFVTFAQGGVGSTYFAYALAEALGLLKPTHLVIQFGSINDTDGDAVSLPLSLAMDNIQSVADFGCNVFATSTLVSTLYSVRNPYVLVRNAALYGHGIKYSDFYPLTVDGNNPNGIASMYADGVHPNGATYQLMADKFVADFSAQL